MINKISRFFGRGLLVAVLSLTMASGLVYQDSAMAGASSAMGKNKNRAADAFPGCCGAPAPGYGHRDKHNGGGDSGSGDGSGGGSDDGSADPDVF